MNISLYLARVTHVQLMPCCVNGLYHSTPVYGSFQTMVGSATSSGWYDWVVSNVHASTDDRKIVYFDSSDNEICA